MIHSQLFQSSFVSEHLPNNMIENKTIGTTQWRSMRKPNTKFPARAPTLPNVNDSAAAITLKLPIQLEFTIFSFIIFT